MKGRFETALNTLRNGIKRPLIPYLGSKWRIAPQVIEHFPPHQSYCEPFGGAAAVLLSKPPCERAEVYNDLNDDLVNLFQVIRAHPGELIRALKRTPYAEQEYQAAFKPTRKPVERARRLIIRAHFGFHSRAVFGERCCMRYHGSRMASDANRFHKWVQTLPLITRRLRNVTLTKQPAIRVIERMDSPQTLHYVDPPYVPSTRKSGAKYRYEMSIDAHRELLDVLQSARGYVVLSGYANELYDDKLKKWRRITIPTRAFSMGKVSHAEEVLWIKQDK